MNARAIFAAIALTSTLTAACAADSSSTAIPSDEPAQAVESEIGVCGFPPTPRKCHRSVCSPSTREWSFKPLAAGTSCGSYGRCDGRGQCIASTIDHNAPWIRWTTIRTSEDVPLTNVGGTFSLMVGKRYTISLRIEPGNGQYQAGVEVNPEFSTPMSANISNRVGTTSNVQITQAHDRVFTIAPSEPGTYDLGFIMRDGVNGNTFNAAEKIRINAYSPTTGLHGAVTSRATGVPLGGAEVVSTTMVPTATAFGTKLIPKTLKAYSAPDGSWAIPEVPSGATTVTVSKTRDYEIHGVKPLLYSRAIAVNVRVPNGSGVRVDTPLEESFEALPITYTTYIDYSGGRTLLHTVQVDPARAQLSASATSGTATVLERYGWGPYFITNGAPFEAGGVSKGFLFEFFHYSYAVPFTNQRTVYSDAAGRPVIQPANVVLMLAISGTDILSRVWMTDTWSNYHDTSNIDWNVSSGLGVIFDRQRDGESDVTAAIQGSPRLLKNNGVLWAEGQELMKWPRTAVGVGDGKAYVVVADGEGLNGAQGASLDQLGRFFRDSLGAADAMYLDGGASSQMVLLGASGKRLVNTVTSDDSSRTDRPTQRVKSFLSARGR